MYYCKHAFVREGHAFAVPLCLCDARVASWLHPVPDFKTSLPDLMGSLACSFETHMQQNCLASVTQMPVGMDDVVVYNSSASCLPSWLKEASNFTVAQDAMPGARWDDLLWPAFCQAADIWQLLVQA